MSEVIVMIIDSLHVKNFKILKEFKYDLSENINLLFGANGSGKTTVTEILNFFMQLNEKKMSSYISSLEDNDIQIKSYFFDYYNNYSTYCDGYNNVYLKLEFKIDGTPVEYVVEIDNENNILEEILKIRLKDRMSVVYDRKKMKFNSNLLKVVKPFYYFFENEAKTTFLSILKYLYEVEFDYETKKDSLELYYIKKISMGIITETSLHNRSFDLKRAYKLEVFNRIDKNADYKENLEGFVDTVELFSEFAKGIDESILECKHILIESNEDNDIFSIAIVKELGGDEISIPLLKESTGTQKYLQYFDWIIKIINDTKAVYVFDEFGLHLHDNLQYRILEYITRIAKENGVQLILSTHNANLLNVTWLEKNERQFIHINPITGERKVMNLVGKDSKENYRKKYLDGFYGGAPRRTRLNLNLDG